MTTSNTADPAKGHLFAPDGTPWCHFGKGTVCLNADRCRNPNHRTSPKET